MAVTTWSPRLINWRHPLQRGGGVADEPKINQDERVTNMLRWAAGISGPLCLMMLGWSFSTLQSVEKSSIELTAAVRVLTLNDTERKAEVDSLRDKVNNIDSTVKAMRMVIRIPSQ